MYTAIVLFQHVHAGQEITAIGCTMDGMRGWLNVKHIKLDESHAQVSDSWSRRNGQVVELSPDTPCEILTGRGRKAIARIRARSRH